VTAPDDASALLDDATEAEWALLHDQFELADGFWIGWIFSPTYTAPRVVAARAQGMLRHMGRALRLWRPESPAALRATTAHLVEAAREQTSDCLWVEALAMDPPGAAPDDAWSVAWMEFLMRTNERREVFVRHHRGGLVFVGPPALKAQAQERSPDLWAYRAMVTDFTYAPPTPLPAAREAAPVEPEPPASEATEVILRDAQRALSSAPRFAAASRAVMQASSSLSQAGRVTDARQLLTGLLTLPRGAETPPAHVARTLAMLAAHEVAQGDAPAAIDHLRAALRHAHEVDHAEALDWCWQLAELLEAQLDVREAADVAAKGVELARGVMATHENVLTIHDLTVFLDTFGNLRGVLGDLDGAEAAYAESLTLRRRLLALRGEVPEALRDLSVSLNEVGNLRRTRGDLDGAQAAYTESLALRRRLVSLHGEVPEALRDLLVSLLKVGVPRRDGGDLDGAEAAHMEAMELARRLLALRGEVPEALRDLSVSLLNVGELRRKRGDLDGAQAAQTESLELARRLLALRGEAPEVLRDLSVSLLNVGDLRRERGDFDGARSAYAESLTLRRRLLALRGEVPEALRDLLRALLRLADANGDPDCDAVVRAHDEARALEERLRTLEQEGKHVGARPEVPPPSAGG
jgi:tetratricopeptide (TPR) repeat protein